LAVAALCLAALAGAAVRQDALTTENVVVFLKAGISEKVILAELKESGFGEALDEARENSLREAGASETLIVALRRAAPAGSSVARPSPAPSPRGGDASFPATVERPRGLTFGANARTVRVPVSVLDKRGTPILGLHGENFEILEDGRPQPVTFFSGERKPLRIALALDVSISMTDKMEEVADALDHFIKLLEPADEILVMTFSDEVNVDQDFTSDRAQLERVFSRLRPAAGTAMYDAAIEAIRRVAPGAAESKAVVLVTDGVDTSSRATYEELRELAKRTEVPVFSIGIGTEQRLQIMAHPTGTGGIGGPRRPPVPPGWPGGIGGGRPRPGGPGGRGGWPGGPGGVGGGGGGRGGPQVVMSEPDFDGRLLRDLADETGARAEILTGLQNDHGKVDRLKDAVESIAMTLRHRYLVGYEPAGGKKGWRKIKVGVDRPSARVQARKGYYTEG
jgi:VWFA-related protein